MSWHSSRWYDVLSHGVVDAAPRVVVATKSTSKSLHSLSFLSDFGSYNGIWTTWKELRLRDMELEQRSRLNW
jgi:hypothetical protein